MPNDLTRENHPFSPLVGGYINIDDSGLLHDAYFLKCQFIIFVVVVVSSLFPSLIMDYNYSIFSIYVCVTWLT